MSLMMSEESIVSSSYRVEQRKTACIQQMKKKVHRNFPHHHVQATSLSAKTCAIDLITDKEPFQSQNWSHHTVHSSVWNLMLLKSDCVRLYFVKFKRFTRLWIASYWWRMQGESLDSVTVRAVWSSHKYWMLCAKACSGEHWWQPCLHSSYGSKNGKWSSLFV